MNMPLTDTQLEALKPQNKRYQIADGGGLYIDIGPGGSKVWRMRYYLGGQQERVTFGPYPSLSLEEARRLREQAKAAIRRGESPMKAKAAARALEREPDTRGALAIQAFSGKKLGEVTVGDAVAIVTHLIDTWSERNATARAPGPSEGEQE
jgi:hypothetical protein